MTAFYLKKRTTMRMTSQVFKYRGGSQQSITRKDLSSLKKDTAPRAINATVWKEKGHQVHQNEKQHQRENILPGRRTEFYSREELYLKQRFS